MPKTRNTEPATEPARSTLPKYSEADIAAIVGGALQMQATYQPFGFALPIAKVYGASVSTGWEPSHFDAWVRFDVTDAISFTLWIRGRDGEWSVTVNPSIRLGEQDARGAETYATAFAIAARAARMVESLLRVDVTVHHPTA